MSELWGFKSFRQWAEFSNSNTALLQRSTCPKIWDQRTGWEQPGCVVSSIFLGPGGCHRRDFKTLSESGWKHKSTLINGKRFRARPLEGGPQVRYEECMRLCWNQQATVTLTCSEKIHHQNRQGHEGAAHGVKDVWRVTQKKRKMKKDVILPMLNSWSNYRLHYTDCLSWVQLAGPVIRMLEISCVRCNLLETR